MLLAIFQHKNKIPIVFTIMDSPQHVALHQQVISKPSQNINPNSECIFTFNNEYALFRAIEVIWWPFWISQCAHLWQEATKRILDSVRLDSLKTLKHFYNVYTQNKVNNFCCELSYSRTRSSTVWIWKKVQMSENAFKSYWNGVINKCDSY